MWFILVGKVLYGESEKKGFPSSTEPRELLRKRGWDQQGEFSFTKGAREAHITYVTDVKLLT
jgi:hypothetical protein